MYCHYLRKEIFRIDSIFFFEILFWEIMRTRQMNDHANNFNPSKIDFDDNNQKKKSGPV